MEKGNTVPPWQTTKDLAIKHVEHSADYRVLQADIIKLCAHVEFLSQQNKKLLFMVQNGLGEDDMLNDNIPMT